MKKILLFTTMALALVVGALSFSFIRVNANTYIENIFYNSKMYYWHWELTSDIHTIQWYYEDSQASVGNTHYDGYRNATGSVPSDDYVSLSNINTASYDGTLDHFYCLIDCNVIFNKSFTIEFVDNTSVASPFEIEVLYANEQSDSLSFTRSGNVTRVTYYIPSEFNDVAIVAIGFNCQLNVFYPNTIRFVNNQSNYDYNLGYDEGYDAGFSDGFNNGDTAYADGYEDGREVGYENASIQYRSTINSMQSTIDNLTEQLNSEDTIGLRFQDVLNNILKWPLKLVNTVFYNDREPVIDPNTNMPVIEDGEVVTQTVPIKLFGVPIVGIVIGFFAISLTIGIIALVKKVWK